MGFFDSLAGRPEDDKEWGDIKRVRENQKTVREFFASERARWTAKDEKEPTILGFKMKLGKQTILGRLGTLERECLAKAEDPKADVQKILAEAKRELEAD